MEQNNQHYHDLEKSLLELNTSLKHPKFTMESYIVR